MILHNRSSDPHEPCYTPCIVSNKTTDVMPVVDKTSTADVRPGLVDVSTAPERPAVSVVLVNWNTRDMLRDCLQSLYRESCDVRMEVIVVDNNSSDASCEMLEEEFPSVRLIS